jgi:adenylosuccinate synthase
MTDPVELDNGDQLAILPHGIKFDNKIKSVLGNGVVIDPQALLSDFKTLSKNGIGFTGRLIVSDRSNIVTGFHHLIANRLHEIRGDSVWLSG